jgi:archaellum component FlaC
MLFAGFFTTVAQVNAATATNNVSNSGVGGGGVSQDIDQDQDNDADVSNAIPVIGSALVSVI